MIEFSMEKIMKELIEKKKDNINPVCLSLNFDNRIIFQKICV